MPREKTIAANGLLLVFVPLAFELAFIGLIVFLLWQAHLEVSELSLSREIIARAHHAGRLMVRLVTVGSTYTITGDARLKARLNETADAIKLDYHLLDELVKDRPEQAARLKQIEASSNIVFQTAREFTSQARGSIILGALVADSKYKQVTAAAEDVGKSLQQLTAYEESVKSRSPAVRAAIRQRLQAGLAAGLLVNLAVCIWLAVLFSRSIAARLTHIIGNTACLRERKALAAPLGGDDEIARLDQSFHQAASELAMLERFKQQVISVLADELKAPLASTRMVIRDFLAGRLAELNETGQTRLNMAGKSTDRLIRLVNDLLDLEDIETGSLQVLLAEESLSDIIDASVSAVRELAAQCQISIQADQANVVIYADEDRLVQAIVNLLSNAVKFSPPEATITVKVKQSQTQVLISVSDQGRGIPEQFQAKIFEKFEQVEPGDARERKGSGLGLAITKTIVEQHGGTISVESKEGAGSTFTIALPLPGASTEKLPVWKGK